MFTEASIFGSILSALGPVVGLLKTVAIIAVPIVGRGIWSGITDTHKRELLQEVAQGAAAAVLLKFPTAQQDTLVQEIVSVILQHPDPPTTSKEAVTRAAQSALAVARAAAVNAAAGAHPGA